jgi:trehalose 6-phosphate synthase
MSPDAQRVRIRAMRDLVRQRNVHLWAAQMLLDAARLRRRSAVAQSVN